MSVSRSRSRSSSEKEDASNIGTNDKNHLKAVHETFSVSDSAYQQDSQFEESEEESHTHNCNPESDEEKEMQVSQKKPNVDQQINALSIKKSNNNKINIKAINIKKNYIINNEFLKKKKKIDLLKVADFKTKQLIIAYMEITKNKNNIIGIRKYIKKHKVNNYISHMQARKFHLQYQINAITKKCEKVLFY